MKKIIVTVIASIGFWACALYACSGHCDYNNQDYEKEVIVFDMAMELYNNFDKEIDIEECIRMARAMYEIEESKIELNKSMM